MLGLHACILQMHRISAVKLHLKEVLTGEIWHILDLRGCRQYNKEQHPDRFFFGAGYFLLEGPNVSLVNYF